MGALLRFLGNAAPVYQVRPFERRLSIYRVPRVDSAHNQLCIGRGRYFSALYHLECVYYAVGGAGGLGSYSETPAQYMAAFLMMSGLINGAFAAGCDSVLCVPRVC